MRPCLLSAIVVVIVAASAPAYIHFPPGDLPKYCSESSNIRVLEVAKFDADTGTILFTVTDTLKGKNPKITSFKQVIDPKGVGVKPIFDWLKTGKKAVLFTIEAENRLGCGYVVLDGFWYSIDYNPAGEYWVFLRADPHLSTVYHGDVEPLPGLVRDLLEGKKVDVPTRKPDRVPEKMERFKEVNEGLIKNRK